MRQRNKMRKGGEISNGKMIRKERKRERRKEGRQREGNIR